MPRTATLISQHRHDQVGVLHACIVASSVLILLQGSVALLYEVNPTAMLTSISDQCCCLMHACTTSCCDPVSCQANIMQPQEIKDDISASLFYPFDRLRKHGKYAWHLFSACSSYSDVRMQTVLCHNNTVQRWHAGILELLL